MPDYDFNAQRLYVDAPFAAGQTVAVNREQANYLLNVLRLRNGAPLLVFNGRDGEWQAALTQQGRRDATLVLRQQMRPQTALPDLWLCFAPLKHARLDYMVQKAVEMGVSALKPVMTRYTQASRVNTERMAANVVEAAEQCGILSLASVDEPVGFEALMRLWPQDRLMIFCDEAADITNPVAALTACKQQPLAVIIGPEGGFAPEERAALLKLPNVLRLAIGPRILRADTAAVAALAVVQATLGDW